MLVTITGAMSAQERAHARLIALGSHLSTRTQRPDSALAWSECKAAQPSQARDLIVTADEAAALIQDSSCITVASRPSTVCILPHPTDHASRHLRLAVAISATGTFFNTLHNRVASMHASHAHLHAERWMAIALSWIGRGAVRIAVFRLRGQRLPGGGDRGNPPALRRDRPSGGAQTGAGAFSDAPVEACCAMMLTVVAAGVMIGCGTAGISSLCGFRCLTTRSSMPSRNI